MAESFYKQWTKECNVLESFELSLNVKDGHSKELHKEVRVVWICFYFKIGRDDK